MKYFMVIVLLVNFVSFSLQDTEEESSELDDFEEKMDAITEQCLQENNIAEFPDWSTEEELLNLNSEFRCFVKCRLVKQGLMSDDGEVDELALKKILDPFNKCIGIKGADACETAFKVFKCNYEAFEILGARFIV